MSRLRWLPGLLFSQGSSTSLSAGCSSCAHGLGCTVLMLPAAPTPQHRWLVQEQEQMLVEEGSSQRGTEWRLSDV